MLLHSGDIKQCRFRCKPVGRTVHGERWSSGNFPKLIDHPARVLQGDLSGVRFCVALLGCSTMIASIIWPRMAKGRCGMRGYIYIFSNPSMPDLVKIGITATSPAQRMVELHTTGVPKPFELEFAAEVADCHACEGAAHRVLDEHRVSTNREFFRVSVRRAIMEMLPVLGDYTLVHVKESYGIEKIEADLRKRSEEQQAIIRAQEAKRACEERQRAREKVQRVAELQRQLASARARLGALGPRHVEPSGLPSLLMLCWAPLPFGWLVWGGSLAAFSGPHYEVGYVCIALLVAGFFENRHYTAHSKAIEPFLPVEREIKIWRRQSKTKAPLRRRPVTRATRQSCANVSRGGNREGSDSVPEVRNANGAAREQDVGSHMPVLRGSLQGEDLTLGRHVSVRHVGLAHLDLRRRSARSQQVAR